MRPLRGDQIVSGSSACLAKCCLVLALLALASVGRAQPARGSVEDRLQAHLEAAEAAQSAKDYRAAAREFESIVALRPDWALVRQSLGVAYHLAGRYAQAIEQLKEAARLDDQLWGAFLFLGMDYYRVGRFEDGATALRRSLALNPDMAEAQRWLGLSLAALRRYEEAILYLSRIAEVHDGDEEALFHLARAYDNRAGQLFELIGDNAPDSPFVYLLQAERFASEGEDERARSEYRRAVEARPDLAGVPRASSLGPAPGLSSDAPGSAFESTRSSFAAGRYAEAAERTRLLLEIEPASIEAMYWLGRSYKGLAASTLERLSQVAPDSHRVDQLEAEVHMGKTEFGKALAAYERALRKRPGLPGLRYAIGAAHSKAGRFEEAAKWFGDELERSPHHALARHALGVVLLDQGHAADAIGHLEQALSADPRLLEARFDLGRAFLENGEHASAIRELEAFLAIDPDHERARFLLANAYRGMGRVEDAARELKRYQELSRRRLQRVQQDVRSVTDDLRLSRP